MAKFDLRDAIHKSESPMTMKSTFVALLIMLSLVISVTFCGFYWMLWSRAEDFTMSLKRPYDNCLDEDMNTDWTFIYAYNAILYLLLSILSLCLLISA